MRNSIYRFGEFELDPHERRLLANGLPQELTPKAFEALLLLVRQASHVVSKEELMTALWPRGFVHESNLAKNVWLIRKVLGDLGDTAQYIETVPKLGYRFVAVVHTSDGWTPSLDRRRKTEADQDADDASNESRAASASGALSPPSAASEDRYSVTVGAARVARAPDTRTAAPKHRSLWALLAIMTAGVGLALVWKFNLANREPSPDIAHRNESIALVDIRNLSANAKDAWLSPALLEMLGTELQASENLHVVPDELVRDARSDVGAPSAGGYAEASIALLHRRLAADYLLSGSYLVSTDASGDRVRMDIALQDARDGTVLKSVSREGDVNDITTLVAQAGVAMRDRLGSPIVGAAQLAAVAKAQPPTAEVARRVGMALDALHRYDPAHARDELLEAIALAPAYAPAYGLLAQAWAMLGYEAKERAALGQALARSEGLPQTQRILIEAQVAKAQKDWPKAVELTKKLIELEPGTPERRFSLIDLLVSSHLPDDADKALSDLRGMPGMTKDDPRFELAAASIANSRSDTKSAAVHDENALHQAHSRDDPGLIATASLQVGIALTTLGQLDPAEAALRASIADFRRIRNPSAEADAHNNLAILLVNRNQMQAAREEYQSAMVIYQEIGDQHGATRIYQNMGMMLWNAGDKEAAEVAVRHALRIARETGDLARQAWGISALATLHSDDDASDNVLEEYRQAADITLQLGDRVQYVFALTSYAEELRERGQLDDAQRICAQARNEANSISDPRPMLWTVGQCAQIEQDRGDIDQAISDYEHELAIALQIKDRLQQANAESCLAQIEIGRKHWERALDYLQRALKDFVDNEHVPGEAGTQILMARCYMALNMPIERDRALARWRELREHIDERQAMLSGDIAAAQLRGEMGDRDGALVDLHNLAADAEQRKWLGQSLDAKLAQFQLLDAMHSPAAETVRAEIEDQAKAHGFGWIIQRVAVIARTDRHPQAAQPVSQVPRAAFSALCSARDENPHMRALRSAKARAEMPPDRASAEQ